MPQQEMTLTPSPDMGDASIVGSEDALRTLVVEDNVALLRTLERALTALGRSVRSCSTVAEARRTLGEWRPTMLILDVELPDGDAFDVLRAAAELPAAPVVIAMSGVASPSESFRLAQLGVRSYLVKPLRLEALEQAIDEALGAPPDVTPHLRAQVGHVPVRELERHVRRTMVEEALARAGGSRRGAARLLQVSRQLLQHMLRSAGRRRDKDDD